MSLRRTTVALEDGLYRQVKRMAVDLGRPMRELIQEALRLFCEGRLLGRRPQRMPHFGAFRCKIRGGLRRADIYEDRV